MPNVELIAEWIAELVSGKHVQGKGKLHYIDADGVDRKCCLGVACDMAYRAGAVKRYENASTFSYGAMYERADLPSEVMEYFGFDRSNPRFAGGVASAHNDGYWDDLSETEKPIKSFLEIADLIKAEYL